MRRVAGESHEGCVWAAFYCCKDRALGAGILALYRERGGGRGDFGREGAEGMQSTAVYCVKALRIPFQTCNSFFST